VVGADRALDRLADPVVDALEPVRSHYPVVVGVVVVVVVVDGVVYEYGA
jgi:hypothetical protein